MEDGGRRGAPLQPKIRYKIRRADRINLATFAAVATAVLNFFICLVLPGCVTAQERTIAKANEGYGGPHPGLNRHNSCPSPAPTGCIQ
jgi:hypothetical protein